jgi:hypothetical protein
MRKVASCNTPLHFRVEASEERLRSPAGRTVSAQEYSEQVVGARRLHVTVSP